MSSAIETSRSPVNTDANLDALLEQERNLDALAVARDAHPDWLAVSDPKTLKTLGYLANACGDSLLHRRLTDRACRLAPQADWTPFLLATRRLRRHGPYEALMWLDRHHPDLSGEITNVAQADLLALRARLLSIFRDFTAAEALLGRALASHPQRGWLWMEKCSLLRAQDRYAAALEASEELIRLSPLRRWAVGTRTDLLLLHNRTDEAVALLQNVCVGTQSGYIACDLASLLVNENRPREALDTLALAEQRLPLAERSDIRWIAARRTDALHRLGRDQEALETARIAEQHGAGYYRIMAERLAATDRRDHRIHLPVGFVRQHHMTCAPATISAIAGYWGRPIDHEQLAADICYDGTPDHAERHWLVERGWIVHEFTLGWDIATALLERGCPILAVTVDVGSAHLQAVIGCDHRLGTFIVRDPYNQSFEEWNAEGVLKEQAAHGPRAFVMLPSEETGRIDGIVFPESELYDHRFAFRRACHLHDRTAAAASLDALRALAPDHQLTLRSVRDLAHYDGNPAAALPAVEELRRRFSDHVNFQIEHIDLLEQLGRQQEARTLLDELGAGLKTYFVFQRRRAEQHLQDARSAPRAGRVLRRVLRYAAANAEHLKAYANHLWETGRRAEAAGTYRLAATVADKTEHYWRSYFLAELHLNNAEACLAMLRARFERWGRQSNLPAFTLADALDDLDRGPEALAVLEDARRLRPEDGIITLRLATRLARVGRIDEARELLAAGRPHCSALDWLNASARVAGLAHDHRAALALWEEIAALSPTDVATQRACIDLIRICEGKAAALRRVETLVTDHPHHEGFREMWLETMRDEPAALALAVADRLVAEQPDNTWLLRERAIILRRLSRHREALADADQALAINPRSPHSHGLRARCLHDLGNLEEAREAAMAGIRLNVENTLLYDDLLHACETFEQRQEAARFIEEQLLSQAVPETPCGDYLAKFRGVRDDESILSTLRRIRENQPGLWSAGSALATHLAAMDRREEAVAVATENSQRFPLLPRVWVDLAQLHHQNGDARAEAEALREALRINPAWSFARRMLSAACEKLGDPDGAETALRKAVELDPADATNHGWLGDLLWRCGRHQDAIACMTSAVRCNPHFDWAWDSLQDWSQRVQGASAAIPIAEELCRQHAGEIALLTRLVRLKFDQGTLEENLRTLDDALQLDPLDADIHDLRAQLLCRHRRYAEAVAACEPAVYASKTPYILRGRAAWIHAQSGRLDEAVSLMRGTVEQHPDYLWGIGRLTEWLVEKNETEEALKWARSWARQDPGSPVPLGWVGSLLRRQGKTAEAREAYASVIVKHPDYLYGARELLELRIEAKDHTGAEELAAHLLTHSTRAEHLRALGLINVARQRYKAAGNTLSELALLPEMHDFQLKDICEALKNARRPKIVSNALGPLLTNPAAAKCVAALWVDARAQQPALSAVIAFHRLKVAPEHRQNLVTKHIEHLAERRCSWGLAILRLTRNHELRANHEWWGAYGYAYSCLHKNIATIRWLRDWRDHPRVEPYMLNNLILSLLRLNRHRAARDVLRHAITLPPDDATPRIAGWWALEQAFAGDLEDARQTLQTYPPPDELHYALWLHELARILIEFKSKPPEALRGELPNTLDAIVQTAGKYPNSAATDDSRHFRFRIEIHCARLAGHRFEALRLRIAQWIFFLGESHSVQAIWKPWFVTLFALLVFTIMLIAALSPDG